MQQSAGWRAASCAALMFCAADAAAQPSPTQPAAQNPPVVVEVVEVVGVTPIHGLGVPITKVPGSFSSATTADLAASGSSLTADFLVSRFAGVHANDPQSNAFQPDIQFRGFVGSPQLGASQGIAVYQDGVRLNEPFGDTLQWSLLSAPGAVASLELAQGSNPLFGLNTLGGALSIRTKNGFTHPGHGVTISAGSFGRGWIDLESGAHLGSLSYFVAARGLREDGWRDFSGSTIGHVFANLGWRDGDATGLDVSVMGGWNRLQGNGTAPEELLEIEPRGVFTHPDRTGIDHLLLSVRGRHTLAAGVSLDGVLSYRPATFRTFNGDDSDYEPCDDGFDGLLCADDVPVVDQDGQPVAAPAEPLDATNNTSETRMRGFGGSLQLTVVRVVAGKENHFVSGMSLDGGSARFGSQTELARLTPTRGTTGSGLIDADSIVRVRTSVLHTSAYVADYLTVTPRTTISGSVRFTHSALTLRDGLGTTLNGDHRYTRVNPAGGVTVLLSARTTAYGSYSVSSRVPSPSEVSCADPEDPCRLPNAFVSDPPLKQVVSRTWEAGARGRFAAGLAWKASIFRTSNRDDLTFISSGALTNEGYFANVGNTLRTGVEAEVGGMTRGVNWTVAYTWLRPTFTTPLTLGSENHPLALEGEIAVEPGDSMPTVPRNTIKSDAWGTIGRVTLGLSGTYSSSQFLRGDESNQLEPLAGYGVVDTRARVTLTRNTALLAQVHNLFNRRYATFGTLGEADDVLGEDFENPRFVSPGAPRAAWVGVEIRFK
jgi:iron complex outermembrane recepter protein